LVVVVVVLLLLLGPSLRHCHHHSCRRWQVEPAGQVEPGKGPSRQEKAAQCPPLPPHWSHSCRLRDPEPGGLIEGLGEGEGLGLGLGLKSWVRHCHHHSWRR
jgi:hypothetical protein